MNFKEEFRFIITRCLYNWFVLKSNQPLIGILEKYILCVLERKVTKSENQLLCILLLIEIRRGLRIGDRKKYLCGWQRIIYHWKSKCKSKCYKEIYIFLRCPLHGSRLYSNAV